MYAYDSNFIRIYKDRAVFSWEDDPARFHERQLTPEEFNYFKGFLGAHQVEQMKPFLACRENECGDPKELLMLSRNGGSRVFVRTSRMPAFFAELEKIFSDLRSQPAAIKYLLSKDVPGLELLFASDEFSAETVWKHGSDL